LAAGYDASQYLNHAARRCTRLDRPELDGSILARHSHASRIAFISDGIPRHRCRDVGLARNKADRRKHFGLEHAVAILDGGAYQKSARDRIERRGNVRNLGLEQPVGISQDGEADRLTHFRLTSLGLTDVSDEP